MYFGCLNRIGGASTGAVVVKRRVNLTIGCGGGRGGGDLFLFLLFVLTTLAGGGGGGSVGTSWQLHAVN